MAVYSKGKGDNKKRIRNRYQLSCWNAGHKVIPDKKKLNNKLNCRQKNRPDRIALSDLEFYREE
jgi:hypothetical protein